MSQAGKKRARENASAGKKAGKTGRKPAQTAASAAEGPIPEAFYEVFESTEDIKHRVYGPNVIEDDAGDEVDTDVQKREGVIDDEDENEAEGELLDLEGLAAGGEDENDDGEDLMATMHRYSPTTLHLTAPR